MSSMSELNVNAIKKLKVAELRAELTRRGLDSKGNKPVLVERLIEAVSAGDEEMKEQSVEENTQETTADSSQNDVEAVQDEIVEAEKEEVPSQAEQTTDKQGDEEMPIAIEAEVKAEPEQIHTEENSVNEVEQKAAQESRPMEQSSDSQSSAALKDEEGRKYFFEIVFVGQCCTKYE